MHKKLMKRRIFQIGCVAFSFLFLAGGIWSYGKTAGEEISNSPLDNAARVSVTSPKGIGGGLAIPACGYSQGYYYAQGYYYSEGGYYAQGYYYSEGGYYAQGYYYSEGYYYAQGAYASTLTVNSVGATTVAITGNPAANGGTTNYTRSIVNGSSFTLTAPATDGFANFVSWTVGPTACTSVSGAGNRVCTVTNMIAARTVTANYIVSPPVTSNVSVTEPNYCLVGPSATIGWSYSDSGGLPQLAYQVQIDNQGSFASPEVDSGKITCQICRSYFSGISILQFNTTYNARVRTWNGNDIPSLWQEATTCTGDGCLGGGSGDWRTPRHAYPNVNPPYDFVYSPANPAANEPVQFTDRTLFAPTSISKVWSWIFVPAGGGSGSSSSQNPTYTFNQDGIYQVTERVRDDALPAGQYCTGPAKSVNIQKPIPIWKEIAPR